APNSTTPIRFVPSQILHSLAPGPQRSETETHPMIESYTTQDQLRNLIPVGALCCLWLGLVAFGWARWGSVTVDSGREIYVGAALAEGKVLYRDVWYPYNPGAPYLNAILFLIFGTHINVAYLAGAHTALAHALTLFLCALYFS